MKVQIVKVESAGGFVDKQRRYTLRFPEADPIFDSIRVPESVLMELGRTVILDDTLKALLTLDESARGVGA